MFRHPAWAVGSYSSGPPAANTVRTKSTGGFHQRHGSPCTCKAFDSRLEDEVEELEEQGEEEEPCGGGEAVDEAEVVHVVAVLGVDLQGRQEPETSRDKIRLRPIQNILAPNSCIKFNLPVSNFIFGQFLCYA